MPPRNRQPSPSRAKVLGFRFLAVVLVPLLLFTFLEAGLRLAGCGYPASFFLRWKTNNGPSLIQNNEFGRRFFGDRMARNPTPFIFPEKKPEGTHRIFVMGGSAANGDPQPEFGLSRMLETLLQHRYPQSHFEVINVAMTAINSHVVHQIARECASHHGDLWVVYMGNNEVVGPYGPGSVFGTELPGLSFLRASLALRSTRTGQAMDSLVNRIAPDFAATNDWGGMQMFLDHQIPDDDPRLQTVQDHFRRNLSDIIRAGTQAGARVVVSTVGTNLKNCGPFASLHRGNLLEAELPEWNRLFQAGIEQQDRDQDAQALASFEQAAAIDPKYADLQFRLAQCHLSLGRADEARSHFEMARDFDALRFRCDNRLNGIIRETAKDSRNSKVAFVDGEAILNRGSEDGIAGSEVFLEHVHLNFRGNYMLARSIAEQFTFPSSQTTGSIRSDEPAWLSETECAERLAWTSMSRYEAAVEILTRMSEAPFTARSDQPEETRRYQSDIEHLLPQLHPSSLEGVLQSVRFALESRPNDWVLHESLAGLLQRTGNGTAAVASWERVAVLLPQHSMANIQLGLLHAREHRTNEAERAFNKALELDPGSEAAMGGLASLCAREGKTERAIQLFERLLDRRPFLSQAHIGLGLVLKNLGFVDQANAHFRLAVEHPVNAVASLTAVGKVCHEIGWLNEAMTNFTKAVRLDPLDATTHVLLGRTLASLGKHDAALKSYQQAVRVDPAFAEAHFRFGFELGRAGNDTDALNHFAEAVKLDPKLTEARVNLGIAFVRNRNLEQAARQFREVLKLESTNQVAAKYLEALSRLKPE